LLPDALSILFKFQVHVTHDMSLIFGIANSVCLMHCCITDYFCNLLLRSFFTFYISASVANKLDMHKCNSLSNNTVILHGQHAITEDSSNFSLSIYYNVCFIKKCNQKGSLSWNQQSEVNQNGPQNLV